MELGPQTPPPPPPIALPPDPATDFRLYTYRDLASLCRVTVQTLQEWVKKGKVPSPRYFGGYTARFNRLLVDEVLKGPNFAGTYTPEPSMRSSSQLPAIAAPAAAPAGSTTSTPKSVSAPKRKPAKKPARSSTARKKTAAKKPARSSTARKKTVSK